jgi:sec-independent protein translocase protein TatA
MASFLTLAFLPSVGFPELVVIAIIALLLFGRRLPEVMRNLGKGIVEFKRGVRGLEEQVEQQSTALPTQAPRYEQAAQPQAQQPVQPPVQQQTTTEPPKPMA